MITTSRYGIPRFINELEKGKYEIYGESLYLRYGGTDLSNDILSIDYEGGPMISVGEDMKFYGGEGIISKIEQFESDKPNHFLIYTNV